MTTGFVRTPASSANLGAGFDVLGMALNLFADCGLGDAPAGAQQLDQHHPGRIAFEALGGTGPMWIRCNIPMARGLGFSGAARVGAAALAVVQQEHSIAARSDEILDLAAGLEGHGDNVAASLFGGVTAFVEGRAIRIPVGPIFAAASFVAWVPNVTTSTDTSRQALGATVDLAAAVHNIGRSVQFVAAIATDDPVMLVGAAADRIHQAGRISEVPGAAEAMDAGLSAGAWAAWLSGSGPTIGFMCDSAIAEAIAGSMPDGGHAKILAIDTQGCRLG
ncbi:homoserine kinase [Ilumatobacter sp.]|uniref:homoserine kinase n=2 Tax=Ilumatobacter sp. TaxID=1967498 RepID=UPI003750C6FA